MAKSERNKSRKQQDLPLDQEPAQRSGPVVELIGDPGMQVPKEPADSKCGPARWFVSKCGGPEEARRVLDLYLAIEYGYLLPQGAMTVQVAVPGQLAGYGCRHFPACPQAAVVVPQPQPQPSPPPAA